ncbi:uncharacterized protein DNG_00075 [Cephalotrichum gorgonifer]|uniref:Uncharacterized protein n=1 Tax=Cephalotrichum gorgonifer TaxID=2041049 RepID=A0AAE8MQ50_9PEZI|nr:uncharacterized protein DNG_00075 [Cephalotrichum gorgonifer]
MAPVLGPLLSSDLWELVCAHPYLLASVLSVSASHLAHSTPDPAHHRVAQRALLSTALETFRPALAQPLNPQNADALVMTSMLLNNLAFSDVETPDPLKSWVFSDRKDRLDWLSLQMGIKLLLVAASSLRRESLLQPMYGASDDGSGRFSGTATVVEVPWHWDKLARQVDERIGAVGRGNADIDERYPCQEAIRVLAAVRGLYPSAENVFMYVQFIRPLDSRFVRLLYDRDEGALWMFGFWLGLMVEGPNSGIGGYLSAPLSPHAQENVMFVLLIVTRGGRW